MHLKQKAYSFGVIHTIITVTVFFSAGRCEPTAPSVRPASPSVPYDAGSSFVTTDTQPAISPVGRRLHLGSKRGGKGPRNHLLQGETFKNMVEPKRDAPEPRLKPRMESLRGTSSKTRFKRRQTEGKRPFTAHGLLNGTCSVGHIEHTVLGKFYITGQFGPNLKHLGYHLGSDGSVQGHGNQARSKGQQPRGLDESWQKLEPTVECGEDAMILTVRRKRATQLVLDPATGSSLLLFQLPPRCGYFVRITPKDLSLKAQYNACHVTQEGSSHVLPLLWRGIPVKVSCPVSKNKLPGEGPVFLCCTSRGMALKLREPSADKEPHINVRGEWTPLSLLANQCGYTVRKRNEEIIIFGPFNTCGVTVKDGNHTLSLQIGKETYRLTCPIQPLEKLPVTHQPLVDNPSFAKRVSKPKLKSLGPLLWIPPFYLAPPNYPHPTYPQLKGHSSYNPSTPLPRGFAFSSQPKIQDRYYDQIPLKESYKHSRTHRPLSSKDQTKDSGRVYKNKQNLNSPDSDVLENSVATTGFTVHAEGPHSQPPGHDFSPYYHYYHLPKILLPGTPQDPGASGRLQSSTSSQSHKFFSMTPSVSQFKDASNKVSPSIIIPNPYTFPTSSKVSSLSASYPLQLFPYYHFFYLPHVKSEAKRLVLLHPHLAAKTNLKSNINNPKMDKSDMSMIRDGNIGRRFSSVTPALQSPVSPSSSHKPDPISVPPLEQSFIPTPEFTHNADPYKYYYHPYNNYLMYYVPETWREEYHGAQITPRAAASSSVQSSNHHHHTPHTESMNDIQKRLLQYYYSFYLPQLVKHNQKLHQDGKKTKKTSIKFASQLSPPFGFSKTQQTASSVPLSMYDPLQSLYSYFVTQQRSSKPSEQHGGKEAEWKLDKEIKDGTAGKVFDFAVPNLVADPSVAPPALPSGDSKRSCRLKKLASHPDVYIVPMNGCGGNKRTMVNLLEVRGIKSHKDGSSYSPGRSMVGCGSSPDFPGKVRFHMKDQPRPPSVSVLLRIATDESFSSYYPKAHLPLSFMQNKPVYVELRLLEPSEPSMVLLVHSCLAYTPNPDGSWMRFYDGCSSRGISQLLPSSDSRRIQRIKINGFPSLPSKHLPYRTRIGRSTLEDPEIYFLCLTEVCSTVHNDCRVKCAKGPNSDAKAMK